MMSVTHKYSASNVYCLIRQFFSVEAIDTVGAGDMFVGAFSAGLFKGECTTSSLQRATVASGLACKFNGAQPSLVTPQLVESELQRLPLPRKIA